MGAVLTFLAGQDALDALAALADEAEEGRSAYWQEELENFSVGADGSVSGHAALGNETEAAAETALVLESQPNYSIAAALKRAPYALESDREHQRETMLKAGLPA